MKNSRETFNDWLSPWSTSGLYPGSLVIVVDRTFLYRAKGMAKQTWPNAWALHAYSSV